MKKLKAVPNVGQPNLHLTTGEIPERGKSKDSITLAAGSQAGGNGLASMGLALCRVLFTVCCALLFVSTSAAQTTASTTGGQAAAGTSNCPKYIHGLPNSMFIPDRQWNNSSAATLGPNGNLTLTLSRPIPASVISSISTTALSYIDSIEYDSHTDLESLRSANPHFPLLTSLLGKVPDPGGPDRGGAGWPAGGGRGGSNPVPGGGGAGGGGGGGTGKPVPGIIDCTNLNPDGCGTVDEECSSCMQVHDDVTNQNVCACNINFGKSGYDGRNGIKSPTPPVASLPGGKAVRYSAPYSPEQIYKHVDGSLGEQGVVEVRHPDGTIVVMESYVQHVTTVKAYRVRYIIDSNSNRIEYRYATPDANGNDSHLEKIIYPNGVVELWTWAYWQTGFAEPTTYDTITVSYQMADGSQPAELAAATWVMQFRPISGTRTQGDRPFAGEYLWRIYYPKSEYVSDPSGSGLHSLTTTNAHTVFEFGYTPFQQVVQIDAQTSRLFKTSLITSIKQFRAQSVGDANAPSDAVTTAAIEYESVFPFRVHEQQAVQFGSKRVFQYFADTNTSIVYKTIETIDPDTIATKLTSTAYDANNVLDPFYRPRRVIYEASPTFRPRTGDPQKASINTNGNFKDDIAEQVWQYTYGGCSCTLPLTVTDPLGRVSSYTYDQETGALLTATVPNPAGNLVGQPSSITFTYSYISPPLQPAGWSPRFLQSVTKSVGTTQTTLVNYTYEWQQRPTYVWSTSGSIDRVTDYGYAPRRITQSSPTVTLAGGGTQVISSYIDRDSNVPPAPGRIEPRTAGATQTALVGLLTESSDGNGVLRSISRSVVQGTNMVLETINPAGAAAERIQSEIGLDQWGKVKSIESNKATSLATTRTVLWNGPTSISAGSVPVGGVQIEDKVYYDRWGNVAVRLKTNKKQDGSAPQAHSPGSGSARDYVRSDYFYLGSRLVRSLVDRRALDRDEAGALSDQDDARMLETLYSYRPDGALLEVATSNGSLLKYTFDGLGYLYMTEETAGAGSGSPSVQYTRYFINAGGEVVTTFLGDGSYKLWTVYERNGAGAVIRATEPSVAAAPTGYAGSLGGGIHEYDYDHQGRVVEHRVVDSVTTKARTEFVRDEIGRVTATREHLIGLGSGFLETSTRYDKASMVSKVTGAGGRYIEYSYTPGLGRLSSVRDCDAAHPNEQLLTYYDGTAIVKNQHSKVYDLHPGTSSPGYHEYVTEYVRDVLGRTTEVRELGKVGANATPLVHQFKFYTVGPTQEYIDPVGKVSRFLPDALGRLVERVTLGSGTDFIRNSSVFYDWGTDARSRVERFDGLGNKTVVKFDFARRPYLLQHPGADFGTEPTPSAPSKFSVLAAYNAASRVTDEYQLVSDASPAGLHVRYHYDGPGRLLVSESPNAHNTSGVSPLATRDVYNRDILGRLTGIWSFTGDIAGTPSYTTLVEQNSDNLGRMHSERYAYALGGTALSTVGSSYNGTDTFRVGLSYPGQVGNAGLQLTFAPDARGLLSQISWQGAGQTASSLADYDYHGSLRSYRNLTVSSSTTIDTDFSYDAYGRLSQILDTKRVYSSPTVAAQFDFEYDLVGNLKAEKYVKQVQGVVGGGDRFTYDSYDRLQTAWLGSDATTMSKTDAELAAPGAESTLNYVEKLTYNHDAGFNRTERKSRPGPQGSTQTTAYTVQGSGDPQGASNRYKTEGATTLLYDHRGNTVYDGQFYYVYDYRNRLSEVYTLDAGAGSSAAQTQTLRSGMTSQTVPELARARGVIHTNFANKLTDAMRTHQKAGVAAMTRASVSFGNLSRQTSASASSSTNQLVLVAVYTYDAFDRRTQRAWIGQGTWMYAYDGWNEVSELVNESGQAAESKSFVWGASQNELVAYRVRVGSVWTSHYVLLGGASCPSRVLSATGGVEEAIEYSAWGQRSVYVSGTYIGSESSVGNPYGWKGARCDSETGLLYVRYRYLNAQMGRWLTPDPIGDWGDVSNRGNGYVYGGANSTSHADWFGLQVPKQVPSAMAAAVHALGASASAAAAGAAALAGEVAAVTASAGKSLATGVAAAVSSPVVAASALAAVGWGGLAYYLDYGTQKELEHLVKSGRLRLPVPVPSDEDQSSKPPPRGPIDVCHHEKDRRRVWHVIYFKYRWTQQNGLQVYVGQTKQLANDPQEAADMRDANHDWTKKGFSAAEAVFAVSEDDVSEEALPFMREIRNAAEQQAIDWVESLGLGTNQINSGLGRYDPETNDAAESLFGTPGMHKRQRGPMGNRVHDQDLPSGSLPGGKRKPYADTRKV